MIKAHFAHLADLHLGCESGGGTGNRGPETRHEDFFAAFERAINQIHITTLADPYDAILISGDIFHKLRPSSADLARTIDLFRKLGQAAPVYAIEGNHDHPRTRQVVSPCRILEEAHVVTMLDGSNAVLPNMTLWGGSQDWTDDDWQALLKTIPDTDGPINILMAHGFYKNEKFPKLYAEKELPLDVKYCSCLDYIALGHLHSPYVSEALMPMNETDGPVWAYPGSIEHTSLAPMAGYTTSETLGYYDVTIMDTPRVVLVDFVTVPIRRRIHITIDATEKSADEVHTATMAELARMPQTAEPLIVHVKIIKATKPMHVSIGT